MAKYRPIHVKIWDDPDFENYSKDQKLIFLFLCTNGNTSESGIYPITIKKISDNTGIPQAHTKEIMEKGIKNVVYDFDNSCVFVVNFLLYNGRGNPNNLEKSILNDFNQTRTPLWDLFKKRWPAYSGSIPNTIPIPIPIPINVLPNTLGSVEEHLKNGKDIKKIYGEFENVKLKDVEYKKLVKRYGKQKTDDMIEELSTGIKSKSYKYSDHYATIISWFKRRGENGNNGKKTETIKCTECKTREPVPGDELCIQCFDKLYPGRRANVKEIINGLK